MLRKIIKLLVLITIIGMFGIIYWQTIMVLPLFGDATIHGANAKDVLVDGWRNINADYPSFYSYLMAVSFSIFGEKGFNLIPYLGFLFLLISSFLLIRQVTKNYYLGLLAMIFVGGSPKLIFYTARMYQEILLTAVFTFCFYLLFRYLEEKNTINIILLALFTGLGMALKQQGLFILYPSIIIFFIICSFFKKISWKQLLIMIFLPLIFCLPFYAVLFHTTGAIAPGSNEFKLLKKVNQTGSKIFSYDESADTSLYAINVNNHNVKSLAANSDSLAVKLKDIENYYTNKAFSKAENRHIRPYEVFLNFDKFNGANNLYLDTQGIPLESPYLEYIAFISIIGGVVYCVVKFKIYQNLLLFSLIFLPINYILFMRNSDQQRYHLFLPLFVMIFMFLFFKYLLTRITLNKHFLLTLLLAFIIFLFTPIITDRIIVNTKWVDSQIYASSEGGIDSIKEISEWIKSSTPKNILIGQQCGNELHYYSERTIVGDWRIYFLDADSLKEYFHRSQIAYYVIYQSQIVPDDEWKTTCWVPRNFYQKMESNFPKAYMSKEKDITVYKLD